MDTEWEIGYFLMSHAVALDEEYRIGHVMMCLSTKVRISKFRLRWFRHVVSVYVYVSGAVCGRTCATPEYSHDTDFSVSRAHRAIPRNTTSLDELRAARPAHDSPPVQMVGKVRRHAPCGGFEPIRLCLEHRVTCARSGDDFCGPRTTRAAPVSAPWLVRSDCLRYQSAHRMVGTSELGPAVMLTQLATRTSLAVVDLDRLAGALG